MPDAPTLRQALSRIAAEYPLARHERFQGHPLPRFIRTEARQAVFNALNIPSPTTVTRASAGRSAFANVPWIGVFDTVVTRSAQRGYYVVYLFAADGSRVHLSLVVGTASVRRAKGDAARDTLRDAAWQLYAKAKEAGHALPRAPIDLASDAELPGDYEAAHACGFAYDGTRLPPNETLTSDLNRAYRAYAALVEASGLMPTGEPPDS